MFNLEYNKLIDTLGQSDISQLINKRYSWEHSTYQDLSSLPKETEIFC